MRYWTVDGNERARHAGKEVEARVVWARPPSHETMWTLPADRWSLEAWREVQGLKPGDRIEVNPRVMMGKPVIRGTRIPVELLLRKLGEGATEADLLDAYPRLTRDDIRAAIRYAADVLACEETVLMPPTEAGPTP